MTAVTGECGGFLVLCAEAHTSPAIAFTITAQSQPTTPSATMRSSGSGRSRASAVSP